MNKIKKYKKSILFFIILSFSFCFSFIVKSNFDNNIYTEVKNASEYIKEITKNDKSNISKIKKYYSKILSFMDKIENTDNDKIKNIYSNVVKKEIKNIYSVNKDIRIVKKIDQDSVKMLYFLNNSSKNNTKNILDASAVIKKGNLKEELYITYNKEEKLIDSIDNLKTNTTFSKLEFSPYKNYILYTLVWKWVDTIKVYDIKNNRNIFTSTKPDVYWFNKNETSFFQCKNSGKMTWFVNILSVPDMYLNHDLKYKKYVKNCENKWSVLNYILSDTITDSNNSEKKVENKKKKENPNIIATEANYFTDYFTYKWYKKITNINNTILTLNASAVVKRTNINEELVITYNWKENLIYSIDKLKTDIRFSKLEFSPYKRYIIYTLVWKGVNTIKIYDIENNRNIFTSTTPDVYWFNISWDKFIQCKDSNKLKGFVNILSVPDMYISTELQNKEYVKKCKNSKNILDYELSDTLTDSNKVNTKIDKNKKKKDKNIYPTDSKVLEWIIDYKLQIIDFSITPVNK